MKEITNYHIQITGPSGSGKSYFAKKLNELGYSAVDADKIEGLGFFINSKGEEVEYNHEGGLDWLEENQWVWSREVLDKYLADHDKIIIFGGASNENKTADLFDQVFYLSIPKEQILKNLMSEDRTNPYGKTEAQQQYASEKIDQFLNNIPEGWIPLYARDPEDLIKEIETHLNIQLVK